MQPTGNLRHEFSKCVIGRWRGIRDASVARQALRPLAKFNLQRLSTSSCDKIYGLRMFRGLKECLIPLFSFFQGWLDFHSPRRILGDSGLGMKEMVR